MDDCCTESSHQWARSADPTSTLPFFASQDTGATVNLFGVTIANANSISNNSAAGINNNGTLTVTARLPQHQHQLSGLQQSGLRGCGRGAESPSSATVDTNFAAG
jgi:hypothetical protein